MGEIETTGPDAEAFLQRILSNDVTKIADGGAQYSRAVQGGRRRPRRPLHLPARRRPLPDGHQRRQPREGPRVVPQAGRGLRRRRSTTACTTYAMLAVQGPEARGIVAGLTDGELPEALPDRDADRRRRARTCSCAAPATPARTASSCSSRRGRRAGLGRGGRRRAPRPPGLGARDTLRLEVCFHLYGNDLMETRGPIEAGLGWCCKEDTGFIGAEAIEVARERGPSEKLVPFVITGAGIARQGNAGRRRRRGHLRHAVAEPRTSASAWPTCRSTRPSRAPRSRSTSAARRAPPRCARSRCTRKEN